jgi:ribA/ribD-fused uncharacterized protein
MTPSSNSKGAFSDVASLRAAVDAGRHLSFFFFWGHRASTVGAVGKWCLSQWWPVTFEVDARRYATAEHFMMAEKARMFEDADAERRILSSSDPAEAKRIGRTVRGFDERVWEQHRFAAVVRGNRAKFEQHPELASFLISRGEEVLVEASPNDSVWGIGLRETDGAARDPRRWPGLNLLGFALMDVRQLLRGGLQPANHAERQKEV